MQSAKVSVLVAPHNSYAGGPMPRKNKTTLVAYFLRKVMESAASKIVPWNPDECRRWQPEVSF